MKIKAVVILWNAFPDESPAARSRRNGHRRVLRIGPQEKDRRSNGLIIFEEYIILSVR